MAGKNKEDKTEKAKPRMENKVGKEIREITGKKVCIICRKELSASEIKDAKKIVEDHVIRIIRKIKNILRIAANNELYVCKNDFEEHKKRRKNFEKSIVLTSVLALIIFLALALLPIVTTGNINLNSIFLGILLAVLLALLNGLIKYVPAREL